MKIYVPKSVVNVFAYLAGYDDATAGKRTATGDEPSIADYALGYLAGLRKKHHVVIQYDSLGGSVSYDVCVRVIDSNVPKGWMIYKPYDTYFKKAEAIAAANALAERLEGGSRE